MPLYEYECDACGHRFEVIQKFSDPALATCDKCGGSLRKLLSSPAIQFKGSGWYITDYARAGKSEEAKGSSGATDGSSSAGTGESKAEAKTDAKTETKAETKTEKKTDTKTESKPSSTPSTS